MKRIVIGTAMVLALAATPAWALFGVGDLTFDASTYGEVASLYKQTVQLYDTAKSQLDSLSEIEKTIKDAQQAYDAVVNTDISKLSNDLKPGQYYHNSDDKIQALRAELARQESTSARDVNYYQYQMQKLNNLERLSALQEATSTNTQRASDAKANTATTSQVTAQSTSTLAALAAAEEQRKQRQELSEAAARQQERDVFHNSKSVYDAIGGAQ